jgi:TetR/AcrR family transcriptional regulator, transcriptional repressor of bet genes
LSPRTPVAGDALPAARGSRNRQRQRLIDACISALHIHGPSRTTVEKVVAIANLSPGIVRFYFKSKGAMLVASLQYLASEFDEKVLGPVMAMRDTPVEAMRRLVELYLDPELASPRKISVWYAFWGEASARQEYYEICGHKDDSFVALVRDLMGRLVEQSGDAHLDVEALSLGFIGLLEVLWQGFAFQFEADIDRPAARERCIAYLRSVFPRQFSEAHPRGVRTSTGAEVAADRSGIRRDRELFRRAAQPLGHEDDVPSAGDRLAVDVAGVPVLVVRDTTGSVRAWLNRCTHTPHELLPPMEAGAGPDLRCQVHRLAWRLDGVPEAGAGSGLTELPLDRIGGLLFLRPASAVSEPAVWGGGSANAARWKPLGPATVVQVRAAWPVVVEHWLDAWLAPTATVRFGAATALARCSVHAESGGCDWVADARSFGEGFAARLFSALVPHDGDPTWHRRFIAPNLIIEQHAGGLAVLCVLPDGPEGSVVSYRAYRSAAADRRQEALAWLGRRLALRMLGEDVAVIESLQRSLPSRPVAEPVAPHGSPLEAFRGLLRRSS